MLMAGHAAGNPMSSSTKGREREQFINGFLTHALPPIYRFETGDANDANGNRSGQLDDIIEYPFAPIIPVGGDKPTRLYLAESVAAVVEVKSDVAGQWDEAKRTAQALPPIEQQFGMTMSIGRAPSNRIPLFVIGYKGWETAATVREKLAECPAVAGILVIESGVYCSARGCLEGPGGLWALICDLYDYMSGLQSAVTSASYSASPGGITSGGFDLGVVKP